MTKSALAEILAIEPFPMFDAPAACARAADPEVMHPKDMWDWDRITAAKGLCDFCPAFAECRAEVDRLEEFEEQSGVWSGETYPERRHRRWEEAMDAKRRLSASAP